MPPKPASNGARASDPAVEVVNLVKRYPKRPTNAVDELDFQVPPGEVFGLLGPNGAGKTTTIGILTTRVVPTSGVARVQGVDVAQNPVLARSMLSVVPQRPNLDFALSARQILLFHAAYHGVPSETAGPTRCSSSSAYPTEAATRLCSSPGG